MDRLSGTFDPILSSLTLMISAYRWYSQINTSIQEPFGWCELLIDDLWTHVASFLSTRHKASLRQTCKRLRRITNATVNHLKVYW